MLSVVTVVSISANILEMYWNVLSVVVSSFKGLSLFGARVFATLQWGDYWINAVYAAILFWPGSVVCLLSTRDNVIGWVRALVQYHAKCSYLARGTESSWNTSLPAENHTFYNLWFSCVYVCVHCILFWLNHCLYAMNIDLRLPRGDYFSPTMFLGHQRLGTYIIARTTRRCCVVICALYGDMQSWNGVCRSWCLCCRGGKSLTRQLSKILRT